MAVIHISEADAAKDFASLMARVRAGDEVKIEENNQIVATIQPGRDPNVRLLSESLEIARQRGFTAVPDKDYADDVRAYVESRAEPSSAPSWD